MDSYSKGAMTYQSYRPPANQHLVNEVISMLTATANRLTIVEIVSPQYWDDCQQCPARDRELIELYSDSPLDYLTIKAKTNRPGWTITGITEIDLSTAPDEF